jgi:hypothetical protein
LDVLPGLFGHQGKSDFPDLDEVWELRSGEGGARPLGALEHQAGAAPGRPNPNRSGARTGSGRPAAVLPLSPQYRQYRLTSHSRPARSGRSCPIGYRYQPEMLAQPARLEADTLYVVGGLYGNLVALRAVLERTDREPGGPMAVVFNEDFHWLDVDPDDFRAVSQVVLARHATKGNVEAELASQEDAGCGCAYPTTWVTTVSGAPTRS